VRSLISHFPVHHEQPFVLVDVGCSGGIEAKWSELGSSGLFFGFDPLIEEIDRLQRDARDNETFECAFVVGLGAAPPSPFASGPFEMTSAIAVDRRLSAEGSAYVRSEFNGGREVCYTDYSVTLDNHFAGIQNVGSAPNFLKTDTDGFDYAVLEGARNILSSQDLIGVEVECGFHGNPDDSRTSTFANIDKLMRKAGFTLYRLSPHNYSRAALPSRFVYEIPAQTLEGTVQWADAVYFRDPFVSQEFRERLDESAELRNKYMLALVVMGFRDVAAQVLTEFPDAFFPGVEVQVVLDSFIEGNQVGAGSYQHLIEIFENDFAAFFPSRSWTGEIASIPEVLGPMSLGRRLLHKLANLAGNPIKRLS